MAEATFYFPNDFWWGTATSAYQVEGHNTGCDWWDWAPAGAACDWWRNADADLDAAAALNNNAHRLSLAWDRIEPEPSRFDAAALDRYREILTGLRARGLRPLVTLHHFTNPRWLAEKGDFTSEVTVDYFARYVRKVVTELGDLVTDWIPINEPLVYITLRYLDEAFPASTERGWSNGMRALRTLLACHAAAYHAIKEIQPHARVGIAKQIRPIYPPRPLPLARWWAGRLDWLFNDFWLQAVHDGRLRPPIGRGTVPHLAGTCDFIGINYYTYSIAAVPPWPGRLVRDTYPDHEQIGDGDYGAVHPTGLFDAIKRVVPYGKPIIITENGWPDDDDDQRPAFILEHLRQIWSALSFNFPIVGYFHWSLVDNFEWERGWTQRFGLIALDPATQARTWRPSAYLYQSICAANAINSEQAAQYAPQLLETMFPG